MSPLAPLPDPPKTRVFQFLTGVRFWLCFKANPNPTADKLGGKVVFFAKLDDFGDLCPDFLCDLFRCHVLPFLLSCGFMPFFL
jgi:hypothetical protein